MSVPTPTPAAPAARQPSASASGPDAWINTTVQEYASKYNPVLTFDDAAAIAGVKMKTVYDWSHKGMLNAFRIGEGKRTRFKRDLFVRWFLEGK